MMNIKEIEIERERDREKERVALASTFYTLALFSLEIAEQEKIDRL